MRAVYLTIVLGLTACSSGSNSSVRRSSDTLSERQRDTILSQSSIPGASGVGKAMRVADSTSAQIRAADTIGN